jgi:hypothetical protein
MGSAIPMVCSNARARTKGQGEFRLRNDLSTPQLDKNL